MRKIWLPFLLVLALAVPGSAQERAQEAPATPQVRPAPEASRELPPALRRLEGRREVDDQALRRQFDRAVGVLIEIQKREIEVDTELLRELRDRRVQRREPPGAYGRPINTIQPAHIPSLEVLRTPLS
jgi:hypothetical protein